MPDRHLDSNTLESDKSQEDTMHTDRRAIQNTRSERTTRRQGRPAPRRQGTRSQVIAAARQEG